MSESTLTSVLYGFTVGLVTIILISLVVVQLVNKYNSQQIPEFNEYESIYLEFQNTTKPILSSQDESSGNVSLDNYSWWNPSKYVKLAKQSIDQAWYDLNLQRAWATLNLIPDSLKLMYKTISVSMKGLTKYVHIPEPITWLIGILTGFTIVFVLVRAIWEKRI